VTQSYDPNYSSTPPGSYGNPYGGPPADTGEYIHPHQRAVILTTRAITYGLYGFIVAVEVILLLGFLLLLGGANHGSSFVDWCYRNLDRVMQPFRGIFEPVYLGTTGSNEVPSVFDASIIFAMLIYAIVGILIYGAASWLTKRLHRLDIEDSEYHARVARERDMYMQQATAYQIAAAQNAAAQAEAARHLAAVQAENARNVAASQAPQPPPVTQQQWPTDIPPPPT